MRGKNVNFPGDKNVMQEKNKKESVKSTYVIANTQIKTKIKYINTLKQNNL